MGNSDDCTEYDSAMRVQCQCNVNVMQCYVMYIQCNAMLGMQRLVSDLGHALPWVSHLAGKLQRVAGAEDAILSNTRTRGLNSKCAMPG